MDSHRDTAGILDATAPEAGVAHWVDPSGQPLADWDLARIGGQYKLVFCFQDACPGCHLTGFPTLARVVDAFRGSRFVGFAAVQTVFEEFETNTFERMLAAQRRYALPIVFGHDAGTGDPPSGSELMKRYRNGGTPWFILIDPDGVVVYNHFTLDADKLIAYLKRAEASPPPPPVPPGTLTWRGVTQLAREGNPPPPRRLELSDEEWRARLTPEQYRITRERGTERAHSSPMCALFAAGRYRCACCGTELFDAAAKFDSHSGWPSFTQALAPGLVAYRADESHGMSRIETTCNVCDAHLGHVFPDGPPPGGLRYCINALALEKV